MFETVELFGRIAEKQSFLNALKNCAVVIIEGISGIGKSSFVFSVQKDVPYIPYYIKIPEKCTGNELMKSLQRSGMNVLPDSCSLQEQIQAIMRSQENTVIYIDDFQNLDSSITHVIIEQACSVRTMKVVCITSDKLKIPVHCVSEVFHLHLSSIDEDSAKDFLKSLSRQHDVELSDDAFSEIIQLTGRNPLFMKLFFACILETGVQQVNNAEQVISVLKPHVHSSLFQALPESLLLAIQYLACFRKPFLLGAALEMISCSDIRKEILARLILERVYNQKMRFKVHDSYIMFLRKSLSAEQYRKNNRIAASYYEKNETDICAFLFHTVEAESFSAAEKIAESIGSNIKDMLNSPAEYMQIFDKILENKKSETVAIYAACIQAYTGNIEKSLDYIAGYSATEHWKQAEILNIRGLAAYRNGDYSKAEKFFIEAGSIAGEHHKARIEYNLGTVYHESGQESQAFSIYKKLCSYYHDAADFYWEAQCENALAVMYYLKCDYDNAGIHYESAIHALEKDQNDFMKSRVISNLALVYCIQGDFRRGLEYLEHSLVIEKKYGYLRGIISTLNNISSVYFDTGHFKKAEETLAKSRENAELLQDDMALAECFSYQGRGFEIRKEYEKARKCYYEALELYQKKNSLYHCASELAAIGTMEGMQHNFYEGRRILLRSLKIARRLCITGRIADIYLSLSENRFLKRRFENSNNFRDLIQLQRYLKKAEEYADSVGYREGICRALLLKEHMMLSDESSIKQRESLMASLSEYKRKQILNWYESLSAQKYAYLLCKNGHHHISFLSEQLCDSEYCINFVQKTAVYGTHDFRILFQRPVLAELLLYMIKNAGQDCLLADIYRAVWKSEYSFENTGTIRMAVARLRKIMGPGAACIETKGKNAYRFIPSEGFSAIWNI